MKTLFFSSIEIGMIEILYQNVVVFGVQDQHLSDLNGGVYFKLIFVENYNVCFYVFVFFFSSHNNVFYCRGKNFIVAK
jgi:hypothetical protein